MNFSGGVNLKIGFILNKLSMGGIESLILNLTEFYSPLHEITIISTDGSGSWDNKAVELGATLKIMNFWSHSDLWGYIDSLVKYINRNKFDVIFLNDSQLGISISPLIFKNTKLIKILHATDENSIKNALLSDEVTDGYIAVSPRIERILKSYGSEKIYLIPNGIKNICISNKRCSISKKVKFLYCGRISHFDKGVLYLPELLSHFKNQDISLSIIGEGADYFELKNEIERKNLSTCVSYLGVLNSDDVRTEMNRADFLIFPSLAEGFGLAIVEAQSVGCIPVTFKIEGVTDFIIEDGVNGIVCEYKNIVEMSNRIKSILESKDLLLNMRHAAIENSQKFSIDKTAENWLQCVEQVSKKENLLDYEDSLNLVIENIATSKMDLVKKYRKLILLAKDKKDLMPRFEVIRNQRIVLFGTLLNSFLTYSYLIRNGISIVGFIDNNKGKGFIKNLPIVSEENLNDIEFDLIVITVESDSRHIIQNRLRKSNRKAILWDELVY